MCCAGVTATTGTRRMSTGQASSSRRKSRERPRPWRPYPSLRRQASPTAFTSGRSAQHSAQTSGLPPAPNRAHGCSPRATAPSARATPACVSCPRAAPSPSRLSKRARSDQCRAGDVCARVQRAASLTSAHLIPRRGRRASWVPAGAVDAGASDLEPGMLIIGIRADRVHEVVHDVKAWLGREGRPPALLAGIDQTRQLVDGEPRLGAETVGMTVDRIPVLHLLDTTRHRRTRDRAESLTCSGLAQCKGFETRWWSPVRAMHDAPVHDEKAVPARVGDSAGVLANARLTGVAGAVLLVLLALEGATILRIHALITAHVFLGMLVILLVLLTT